MSGGAATPTNRRAARTTQFFLALGLLAAAGMTGTAAQPGQPDEIDDKPPLPATEPKRAVVAQKYQIPNRNARIFKGTLDPKTKLLVPNTGIVDFTPVATEKENADEYQAWNEVVRHAKQFTAAELEEHAGRDMTRDDLIGQPRFLYRLELLRFDGKLVRARRLAATKALREAGTAEVYEALIAPLDEPATDLVSFVFTELPEALAGVRQKPQEQWTEADAWVTAAGYFFKAKQDAPKDDPVPVLIGKSLSVLKGPPPGPDKNNPAALDKGLRVFKFIENDTRVARGDDNWEEAVAWNRVLLHARRFSPEELEANARTDLTFADLHEDGRRESEGGGRDYKGRRDYKLDLVRFEGRLLMLRKMELSKKLRDAGVETLYEGWLVPKDEPRGNPVCVVFTDPPEGVESLGRVNKWVSFAGYAFKLMRYESGEQDKNGRYVTKRAPLLLGRALIARPDPDAPSNVSWRGFVAGAVAVVVALVAAGLGLGWWFRRGDRKARQEIQAHRARNPFGESAS
jgi:hypothetical protein